MSTIEMSVKYLNPFGLSLSKAGLQSRSWFDKLTTNG